MARYRIRTVPTASGSKAIQVVRYCGGITKVIKHIGSAKTNDELTLLKSQAEQYIADNDH